jgi:plasmid maintenance system antidote protein VapI
MKEKKINIGGVNGLGEGLINTNSAEFIALKEMIQNLSSEQSAEEEIENRFLSIRFQMESYLNRMPEQIILAGDFLEQFLKAIKVKKKDFAAYIQYEESNFSALLKGRRKINSDLALKLGKIFKINPAIWLHIESKNELIRESEGKEELYEQYSLKDLLKKAG